MQVVDASVLIEGLRLDSPLSDRALDIMGRGGVAPELIDIEVTQVLRRLHRRGELGDREADTAVKALMGMPLTRRPHRPFLPRIWELRDDLTAYDAAYVALAEALGCPLVTADARIAAAPGVHCEIVVLGD